jgi:predicted nuclease of predicted toxin-antitoxin system
MRFLVDQNVPLDVVEGLRAEGHNVSWAQVEHPGADDDVLLEIAQKEERIAIPFDTDFGALAFHHNLPASSGIILFRLTLVSPTAVAKAVLEAIQSRSDWNGHFSVVDDSQIRMRPLQS